MQQFLSLTIAGIATYGCVYALTAIGLVVTYTTSGIFNFAQGSIGMIGTFLYWQFSQSWHWPAWAALIVVVFVISPLLGAGIERTVVRRLENAALEAKLTVTVALLLLGIAVATAVWDPSTSRTYPEFFPNDQITIGGVTLTYHQLIIVGLAIAAAIALRLFFYRTRVGIATRAVVDDRELSSLTGATPARYGQLGWAMGCALACLAGILIGAVYGNLDITELTLLVVNGYAAAMVGRLRSLPLTFLGAIILGLLYSYAIGYLPVGGSWSDFVQVIPMLFLLLVILVLPEKGGRLAPRVRARAPRIVGLRESAVGSAAVIALAVIFALALPASDLIYGTRGVSLSIILLSLVLLTGYGRQVSLCQLAFAGLGAWAMAKVGGNGGSLLGILAAIGLAAGVGAIVALPSLRLRGVYLALATLAFAVGMDYAFFGNITYFGASLSVTVAKPHLPGVSLNSNRSFLIVLGVVFAVLAFGVLAFRRSRYGRRLLAISDSPAACVTLGIDMTVSKFVVFILSAGMAGLGGALYGSAQANVGPNDFQFILSLTVLLLAVIWGIRTVGGMLLGGLSFALSDLLNAHVHHPRDAFTLLVGLAAIGISQNPEGTFGGNTPLQKWRDRKAAGVRAASPDGGATPAVARGAEEGLSHAAS